MPPRRKILEEYDAKRDLLGDFGVRLMSLLEELIIDAGLQVHSVSQRVKERSSLERKLGKRPRRYAELTDITDVLGLRVITYFEDDVDRVASLVESEFTVDPDNSEDRRKLIAADRFGYLSVHYVARLSAARQSLTEYGRFAGCRFEIQIRSILQHAWAEIEHDLGYKSKDAIPALVRRQFSQLAGILENADAGFSRIRADLVEYEAEVEEAITSRPESLGIDQESVASLMRKPLVQELDRYIAAVHRSALRVDTREAAGTRASELQAAGFSTIGEAEVALSANEDLIRALADHFASQRGDDEDEGWFTAGVALFYLGYVHIASAGDRQRLLGLLDVAGIAHEAVRAAIVEEIVEFYRSYVSASERGGAD